MAVPDPGKHEDGCEDRLGQDMLGFNGFQWIGGRENSWGFNGILMDLNGDFNGIKGICNEFKGFAADRGSLEMDSRVLGDLVLPLIV